MILIRDSFSSLRDLKLYEVEIIKEIRRRKSSTSIFEKLQQVNRFLTNKNEIEIEKQRARIDLS